jgi:hypothetical protein
MRSKIMNYNKIKPTSPDKVKGKLVKYRKGDCLSVHCGDGRYLAVFISEKFNKYYDFTFIEYLKEDKATIANFINGRFFGCFGEDMERVFPAVHKNMMSCLEVDANSDFEKVGSLELVEPLAKSSYGYDNNIQTLLQYYLDDLPQRQTNTINFDRLPNQVFIGNRLIEMKQILKVPEPLTGAL